MTTALICWWHRAILRHKQTDVPNGDTEGGTWCRCDMPTWWYRIGAWSQGPHWRWFPSDGGRGR